MIGFLATLALILIPSALLAAPVVLVAMAFGVGTMWFTLPIALILMGLLSWFVLAPMIDRVSDW